MKAFKKQKLIGYRSMRDPRDQSKIIRTIPVYKEVWDMGAIRTIGAIAVTSVLGVFAALALSVSGGASVTAEDEPKVSTTVVQTQELPISAQDVCSMPQSNSYEYDMYWFNERIFNARDWRDNGITLVFQWLLPEGYEENMLQFESYVNKFSDYTGIEATVVKGYDESAADIDTYEWQYIKPLKELDKNQDDSYSKDKVDYFLSNYDPTKIGIEVVLDEKSRDDNAVAWVEMNSLKFGIVDSTFWVQYFNNGKYSYWDMNHGNLILHELGHIIGLGHSHDLDDGIIQGDSVMSYEVDNSIDYYLPGDIAAMQKIFCD